MILRKYDAVKDNENEEHDTDSDQHRSEQELIDEQLGLMENKPQKEKKKTRHYCHTMDGITSGSHIYTPVGFGLDKTQSTITRLSDRRKK